MHYCQGIKGQSGIKGQEPNRHLSDSLSPDVWTNPPAQARQPPRLLLAHRSPQRRPPEPARHLLLQEADETVVRTRPDAATRRPHPAQPALPGTQLRRDHRLGGRRGDPRPESTPGQDHGR